jgi:Flp pilus assembly pilin Flp
MSNTLKKLWNDETGLIVSGELVLICTLGVLAMVVGLHAVAKSINAEMNDVAGAFGALDQSYWYAGLSKSGYAAVAGGGYIDAGDYCDCSRIT